MAKKGRSPSYPGISLKKAEELVRKLYPEILRHSSPQEAIIEHLGYSPKSGSGLVAFAALKRFGLLDHKRAGDGKLSELALDIVLDEREISVDRDRALRRAALTPKIHKQLWEMYGAELPADPTIHHFLTRKMHFTAKGATDFITQFRSTIAYANLSTSDVASEGEVEESDQEFSVGDYVQWERNGVLQLPEACKIAGLYGPEHVVLEGSSIVVPIHELIAKEPPAGEQLSPPPPLVNTPGSGTQMKQATLPLNEGMMMFQWSSPLSESSKKLAEVWIDNIVKELIDATDDQEPDSSPQQESDD